ncbi:MAG: ABC transporter ATP-binding protein [Trichlorobacter sp.]
MQPVIALQSITKTFGSGDHTVTALQSVSFEVQPGEFVAILGASGSGKSTCMNILGCLDTPTSGVYLLDGVDTAQMSSDELADIRNRKLGFVFHGFNLLSRTSARENVELPLVYAGVAATEREDKALQALERVGLASRAGHTSTQLSGGQQQRVAIARALINAPAVILADEPTGNLDTKTTEEIMQLFTELHQSGITIVMITHEPDVARYASRRITFRDGTIISDTGNSL